ncbi:MAG TPA: subclass B3 metallo-beta-lactamase [Gemmatimonadaceae bacterium]|nr:subclass B3 metallo-beta-lactamase [Gemmatimonadaceae bacterium]
MTAATRATPETQYTPTASAAPGAGDAPRRHPAVLVAFRFAATMVATALVHAAPAAAQQPDSILIARGLAQCRTCAPSWFADQKPVRIYGNTYYVGTRGLGAILVTSPHGHILIDGGLPQSPPLIVAHIRALGFRVRDVKLILNTHAHYDHAGGIAELAKASGAVVAASAPSAAWLERGASGKNDPQYGIARHFPAVPHVRVIRDGEVVRVGDLALTAHLTPGHTPGGTSWSWQSCEAGRCLEIVYADSQTPVSADDFLFTKSRGYPTAIADFAHSAKVLDGLRCDILVTPHPEASALWDRVAARDSGRADALIDASACKRYAAAARAAVSKRIAKERGQ